MTLFTALQIYMNVQNVAPFPALTQRANSCSHGYGNAYNQPLSKWTGLFGRVNSHPNTSFQNWSTVPATGYGRRHTPWLAELKREAALCCRCSCDKICSRSAGSGACDGKCWIPSHRGDICLLPYQEPTVHRAGTCSRPADQPSSALTQTNGLQALQEFSPGSQQ